MKYGELKEKVTLSNGVKMPKFGFGTVFINKELIIWALKNGFQNIDTASDYDNEAEVGKAIRSCGLKRDEIFITTKLWNSNQGYNKTLRAFECSCKELGVDYIDLYLIHWPCPNYNLYIDTWRAMEKLYSDGYIRAIGVSNFLPEWIERIARAISMVK